MKTWSLRPQTPDREPPSGNLQLTRPAALAASGVIGLLLGWGIRPLALRLGWIEPSVSWSVIFLVGFVALIVGASAWLTRRTLRRDRLALSAEQAVNRLVLGKACALVGAFFLGAFVGYAIAQLGVADVAAGPRMLRSPVAAAGSALMMVFALLLERACRVP